MITKLDAVKLLSRDEVDILCYFLLMKRKYDGLNNRNWNAIQHYKYEMMIQGFINGNESESLADKTE